jgi:FtsH-binding integral membrane protein
MCIGLGITAAVPYLV